MERTGVVLEVVSGQAIVLVSGGEFCEIPAPSGCAVGMELTWSEICAARSAVVGRRRGRHWLARLGVGAAAAVLAVGVGFWQGLGGVHPLTAQAYAFVSLDINPALILTLDSRLTVVSDSASDADGRTLLAQLDVHGMSMKRAMGEIVARAVTDHMVPAADHILVATAPVQPGENIAPLQTQALTDLQRAVQASIPATLAPPKIYSVSMPTTLFIAANRANVPPGRLAAWLVAAKQGVPLHTGTAAQNETQFLNQAGLQPVLGSLQQSSLAQVLGIESSQQLNTLISELNEGGILSMLAGGLAPTLPAPSVGNGYQRQGTSGWHARQDPDSGNWSVALDKSKQRHSAPASVELQIGDSSVTIPMPPGMSTAATETKSTPSLPAGLRTLWQGQNGNRTDGQSTPTQGESPTPASLANAVANVLNSVGGLVH